MSPIEWNPTPGGRDMIVNPPTITTDKCSPFAAVSSMPDLVIFPDCTTGFGREKIKG